MLERRYSRIFKPHWLRRVRYKLTMARPRLDPSGEKREAWTVMVTPSEKSALLRELELLRQPPIHGRVLKNLNAPCGVDESGRRGRMGHNQQAALWQRQPNEMPMPEVQRL